jgi:RecQ family ATP-dependent DNA helicase
MASSTATANNLSENLNWLLKTKSFIPPVSAPLPIQPLAVASAYEQGEGQVPGLSEDASNSTLDGLNDTRLQKGSASATSELVNSSDSNGVVRSKNASSSLVKTSFTGQGAYPNTSSVAAGVGKSFESAIGPIEMQKIEEPLAKSGPSVFQMGSKPKFSATHFEPIDLTLDNEDIIQEPKILPKKRKSEDVQDKYAPTLPTPSKRRVFEKVSDFSDFMPVDDDDDDDEILAYTSRQASTFHNPNAILSTHANIRPDNTSSGVKQEVADDIDDFMSDDLESWESVVEVGPKIPQSQEDQSSLLPKRRTEVDAINSATPSFEDIAPNSSSPKRPRDLPQREDSVVNLLLSWQPQVLSAYSLKLLQEKQANSRKVIQIKQLGGVPGPEIEAKNQELQRRMRAVETLLQTFHKVMPMIKEMQDIVQFLHSQVDNKRMDVQEFTNVHLKRIGLSEKINVEKWKILDYLKASGLIGENGELQRPESGGVPESKVSQTEITDRRMVSQGPATSRNTSNPSSNGSIALPKASTYNTLDDMIRGNPKQKAGNSKPVEIMTDHRSFQKGNNRDDNSDEYFDEEDDDFWQAVEQTQQHNDIRTRVPQPLATRSKSIHQEARGFKDTTDHNQPNLPGTSLIAKAKSNLAGAPDPSEVSRFPWSGDVFQTMKRVFKLKGFRLHQLESINATLAGKDVFVLMPTGGGKSLCYQLPALVDSGKTKGITVVISPLLSLMDDQVNRLRQHGVQAFCLHGECTPEMRSHLLNGMSESRPQSFVRLLYLTPEMINKSPAVSRLLDSLHSRQLLARIVIDEAHCVSQWGHDFRPDYTELGNLRARFPGLPFMALTATATENVRMDVQNQLHMRNCEMYKQSFNRPNLFYEIRTKSRGSVKEVASLITSRFNGMTGIVYCLSRKECESIAQKLSETYGINAQAYHAGMEPAHKKWTQEAWQTGECLVIVATIAFGMGIDKPDVRFVVHHSAPKSLEGYYQETGRAGRDGQMSYCFLFYSGHDMTTYQMMIKKSEGNAEQKERQRNMLKSVTHYCMNKSDCRRLQVLRYFNESFERANCRRNCDNCASSIAFVKTDVSFYAKQVVELVRTVYQQLGINPIASARLRKQDTGVTMAQLIQVFLGSKSGKPNRTIQSKGWDRLQLYGSGANLQIGGIERLFLSLLAEDVLREENKPNASGFVTQYIMVRY